jgi:hypothetical protein
MFQFLQVVTTTLAAIAMGLSLAHALEYPGKLRLDRETYLATQAIYYPGFTCGGASEPAGILATVVLLIATPTATAAFWLTLAVLLLLGAAHAVFWLVTQPVNKFWLAGEKLGRAGERFFAVDKARGAEMPDWTVLRDRWEFSHIARAVLQGAAFVLLVIAVTL